MSTYEEYGTDKKKEEEGVWVTMGDGSQWLIARGSSSRSRKALRGAQAKYRGQMQRAERTGKDLPDEITDDINLNWAVNGLVVDWKTGKNGEVVTGRDGNPLPFSKENVKTLLEDLPDLFSEVISVTGNAALFKEELDEEASKNLSTPSSGVSSGGSKSQD